MVSDSELDAALDAAEDDPAARGRDQSDDPGRSSSLFDQLNFTEHVDNLQCWAAQLTVVPGTGRLVARSCVRRRLSRHDARLPRDPARGATSTRDRAWRRRRAGQGRIRPSRLASFQDPRRILGRELRAEQTRRLRHPGDRPAGVTGTRRQRGHHSRHRDGWQSRSCRSPDGPAPRFGSTRLRSRGNDRQDARRHRR